MKPKYANTLLLTILIIGAAASLVSCASRDPAVYVLRSKQMDKQAQKICGAYDTAFTQTISSNWWNLLESKPAAHYRERGKVILKFGLHSNGQVTDMKIVESSASTGERGICEKAVLNGVPYPSWSKAILNAVGTNCCTVKFTFVYQ